MENETAVQSSAGDSGAAHTSAWIVVVLLLIFPPLAWYFMWRERRYHSWFPMLVVLYGVLTLVVSLVFTVLVLPKFIDLYRDFGVRFPTNAWVMSYAGIAYGILQVSFGLYARRRLITSAKPVEWLLAVSVLLLLLNFLGGGVLQAMMVISVLLPIYNLTSSI